MLIRALGACSAGLTVAVVACGCGEIVPSADGTDASRDVAPGAVDAAGSARDAMVFDATVHEAEASIRPCTTVVTSQLTETSPYGADVVVSYSMVGGGGGAGCSVDDYYCYLGGGGGGGSSAIVAGATLVVAAGGAGGASSCALSSAGGTSHGSTGVVVSGPLTLGREEKLGVYVGGGGGAGVCGGDWPDMAQGGGGGASGYQGGGGGCGVLGTLPNASAVECLGGGGGGAEGGVGGSVNGTGYSGTGGEPGGPGLGGIGGGGGAPAGQAGIAGAGGFCKGTFGYYYETSCGGGGGGFGGGGGNCSGPDAGCGDAAAPAGFPALLLGCTFSGGSDGGHGWGGDAAGIGASAWAHATMLPDAAGAGAVGPSGGGNAGLVILTYMPPDGVCRL